MDCSGTYKILNPCNIQHDVFCVFVTTTGKISSIIVDIKEDEDGTVSNPCVPPAPPAAVIGMSADVKEVMRAQLAINPSLPKSLQAPLEITPSSFLW